MVGMVGCSLCFFRREPQTASGDLKSGNRKRPNRQDLAIQNSMNSKLYVGNLSFDTTESDLNDLFSQAGAVRETALITDKATGRSRGFAFVTMADSAGAEAAASKYNGMELHGRKLTVNEAKDRESGGGGGGGGRPPRRY